MQNHVCCHQNARFWKNHAKICSYSSILRTHKFIIFKTMVLHADFIIISIHFLPKSTITMRNRETLRLFPIDEKIHQKSSSFSHAQKPMKMFNLQCLYQKTIIFVCSIVMQNKSKIQNVTFAWKCIFFTQAHNSSVAKGLGFREGRRRHKVLLWVRV